MKLQQGVCWRKDIEAIHHRLMVGSGTSGHAGRPYPGPPE